MEIVLYVLAVMYTPGPVNMMSLLAGLRGLVRKAMLFCLGVAVAIFISFLLLGYAGAFIISPTVLPYIALLGGFYIIYLAIKIFRSSISYSNGNEQFKLTFIDGFVMQLINPKNITAVLPIATVMYPSYGITGLKIVFVSIIISIFGGVSPFLYTLMGYFFNKKVTNTKYFDIINKIMSILLLFSSVPIFYEFYQSLM